MRIAACAALAVVAFATRLAAGDFIFLGPAPTRNFQPIQLIFLNLPFEAAATVPASQLEFQVYSSESNVIATTQGPVESQLKFETNRTVLAVTYGFAPRWDVQLAMPLISRFGGGLDPVIDGVEGAFGATNPERDFFPDNSFAGFRVARNGIAAFDGGTLTLAPGDLWITAKREIRFGGAAPRLAVRLAMKAPSGDLDDVTGSGKPDFGLGVVGEYQPWRRLQLYMNVNLVYPVGPITPLDLTLNPMVNESFAIELAVFRHWSTFIHQAVYTSPLHGTGTALLDNPVVELGLGINWAWRPELSLQLMAIDNVSGVEAAADFSLLLAIRSRWGRS